MTDRSGNQVLIHPIFFHRLLETAKISGWQVVQQQDNRIEVLITGPEPGFDENSLARTLVSELERLGVDHPFADLRYVESFERTSIGKIYQICALK